MFSGKAAAKVPRRGDRFFPGGRQAAKPPIGRRGLRGAEVLPPWLRGASPPQRKAPQGVKKARRRKQSMLWNADQNIVFTIIAKESTEGSPLFCFRGKLRRGGGFFPGGAATERRPPFSGESGGNFSERRRRLSGCAFFRRAHSGAASAWGLLRVLRKQKKSTERLIFFFVVYFFMPQKALGYTPRSKV